MKGLEFIVKEIREGELDIRKVQVSASEVNLEVEDVKFVAPVHSHIQFLRHDQSIYVKASLWTSSTIECRRCIEPIDTDIMVAVELQFCQADDPEKIDPRWIDGGERHYSGETLDLAEDARQALALEIPFWPLCSGLWKGLCANCGVNLNVAECGCHELVESSSPFATLSDLWIEKTDNEHLS